MLLLLFLLIVLRTQQKSWMLNVGNSYYCVHMATFKTAMDKAFVYRRMRIRRQLHSNVWFIRFFLRIDRSLEQLSRLLVKFRSGVKRLSTSFDSLFSAALPATVYRARAKSVSRRRLIYHDVYAWTLSNRSLGRSIAAADFYEDGAGWSVASSCCNVLTQRYIRIAFTRWMYYDV